MNTSDILINFYASRSLYNDKLEIKCKICWKTVSVGPGWQTLHLRGHLVIHKINSLLRRVLTR